MLKRENTLWDLIPFEAIFHTGLEMRVREKKVPMYILKIKIVDFWLKISLLTLVVHSFKQLGKTNLVISESRNSIDMIECNHPLLKLTMQVHVKHIMKVSD